jgi:hypothetical protein
MMDRTQLTDQVTAERHSLDADLPGEMMLAIPARIEDGKG